MTSVGRFQFARRVSPVNGLFYDACVSEDVIECDNLETFDFGSRNKFGVIIFHPYLGSTALLRAVEFHSASRIIGEPRFPYVFSRKFNDAKSEKSLKVFNCAWSWFSQISDNGFVMKLSDEALPYLDAAVESDALRGIVFHWLRPRDYLCQMFKDRGRVDAEIQASTACSRYIGVEAECSFFDKLARTYLSPLVFLYRSNLDWQCVDSREVLTDLDKAALKTLRALHGPLEFPGASRRLIITHSKSGEKFCATGKMKVLDREAEVMSEVVTSFERSINSLCEVLGQSFAQFARANFPNIFTLPL